jgi:membrane associated rhomboid family serine protease
LVGPALVLGFVALLYLVELVDGLDQHRLDWYGIRPLQTDGLWGILFAPILHASWAHLYANTGPLVVLGLVGVVTGLARFVAATVIIWALGGFGTWLIGGLGSAVPTVHLGASGLIFGWLAYLVTQGVFNRRLGQILLGLVVFLVYGAALWGVLPVAPGVSWQGHLTGAGAGVSAAYILADRPSARQRKQIGSV